MNISHWTAGEFSPIGTTGTHIEFVQLLPKFTHIIALNSLPSPLCTNYFKMKSTDWLSYNEQEEGQ